MAAQQERPTLDSVARAAGVSKATASKVLNGRGGVSDATRDRVHEVMRQLRYSPSTGRPAAGSVPMVTVLFDAHETLYAAQVLAGVVAAGLEVGVDVVTTNPSRFHAHELLSVDWLRSLMDKGHLGAVVVTTQVSAEAARNGGAVRVRPGHRRPRERTRCR